MKTQIKPEIYQAAHESAVFANRSALGMLKISGETRLDLIHRMSTQAVVQLKPGEGAATILTTDIGRIIDRLILYAGSSQVYAITGEHNADNIARYLMRFVFFNDDFHLEDISAETAILGIYGPQAEQVLQENFDWLEVDIPLHHWREIEIAGITAYLHRTDPINGHGFFLTSTEDNQALLEHSLRDIGLIEADEKAFDYLRIEAGQPRFGHELTQDYIPLEAGLWDDVSFNKGCYIGQEIIARMESRGKLAKKLVRLRSSAAVEPGEKILADGKSAGTITSSAAGPDDTLALGYVKTNYLASDTALKIGERLLSPVYERALN